MVTPLKRVLDAFNDWFCSDAGTVQTLAVCLAVVAVELADPRLDPHAFLLMAVLTVYSAVTQPALARAGRTSAAKQETLLQHIADLEERIDRIVEHKETP